MIKNLLILPDGTELFSGTEASSAIQSVTLTQCVNADKELTLGSVCASALEVKLITPGGELTLTAGDAVTLYKVEDSGARHKQGVFTLETPTRTTANTMKLTGYDNMTKLDKDLTEWLSALTGWPYNILTFASMVCGACGLSFLPGEVPNRDFSVAQFSADGVTGRQLMKWIGEVTCSFCRANADGKIKLGWYTPLTTHAIGYREGQFDEILHDPCEGELTFASQDVAVSHGEDGDIRLDSDRLTVTDDGNGNVVIVLEDCIETVPYFQRGLDYEEYTVRRVDGVQLQLGSGQDAYRWPAVAQGANCYVFSGNPLLSSASDRMLAVLNNIQARLSEVSYTPCKVSVPAVLDIKAGDILSITDKNGKVLTVYAMTAKTAGQKLTVECTGSHRRDSTEALSNPSQQQMALGVAQNAAKQAVDGQTQQDIFNKLTENGALQGLYMKDGQLYINASYIESGLLIADLIQSGAITSEDGSLRIDLDRNYIRCENESSNTGLLIMNGYFDVYDSSHDRRYSRFGVGKFQNMGTGETYYGLKAYTNGNQGFDIIARDNSVSVAAPSYEDPEEMVVKEVRWRSNGDGTFTLVGI